MIPNEKLVDAHQIHAPISLYTSSGRPYLPVILQTLLKVFCVALMLMISFGCSEDAMEECELENTGMIRVNNSRQQGQIIVHFNKSRLTLSNADLSIGPGETQSIQLAAGLHQYTVGIRITNCVGNRCGSFGDTLVDNEHLELDACETKNLIF